MLRRLSRLIPGTENPEAVMTIKPGVSTEEPCEDCGGLPADQLVEVRWLCLSCAHAERAATRLATEATAASDTLEGARESDSA
jgi:hypothetical protein